MTRRAAPVVQNSAKRLDLRGACQQKLEWIPGARPKVTRSACGWRVGRARLRQDGAPERLLDAQVLDGLLCPVNGQGEGANTEGRRQRFIALGGTKHLLTMLDPSRLFPAADANTCRACYCR